MDDFDKRLNRLEELILLLLPNQLKFNVGDILYYDYSPSSYKQGIVRDVKFDKIGLKWNYYVEWIYEHTPWHKGVPNQKLNNFDWKCYEEYLFKSLEELKTSLKQRIDKELY